MLIWDGKVEFTNHSVWNTDDLLALISLVRSQALPTFDPPQKDGVVFHLLAETLSPSLLPDGRAAGVYIGRNSYHLYTGLVRLIAASGLRIDVLKRLAAAPGALRLMSDDDIVAVGCAFFSALIATDPTPLGGANAMGYHERMQLAKSQIASGDISNLQMRERGSFVPSKTPLMRRILRMDLEYDKATARYSRALAARR